MSTEIHEPTVRAMLQLLGDGLDGDYFYFNKPNNYGRIRLDWYCGKGDPWELYCGPPVQRNGCVFDRWTLNEAAVQKMVQMLKAMNS